MHQRLSKCRICRTPFQKRSISHKDCSPECAVAGLSRDKARLARKLAKSERERLKSRREWLADAQKAFNAYIRKRDEKLPCISCGRHHNGQYHAGHYMSTGARPELRFDESNCHKQCAPCNNHLSGNIALYRVNLIVRIGLAEVERLEGPQEVKKWAIPELKAIRQTYKDKLKELNEVTR